MSYTKEYYLEFTSYASWKDFCINTQILKNKNLVSQFIHEIRTKGFYDLLTDEYIHPNEIIISGENYRETIYARKLISRTRAVLLVLKRFYLDKQFNLKKLKIYSPEAITPFALYMRGIFPFFLGSEYGVDRDSFFPIPIEDIQSLSFKNETFDCVIANDIFEHIPSLDKALSEVFRILKQGGLLISTFPFAFNSEKTVIKAQLRPNGTIKYLSPPEYHENPVNPKEGSLVFQVPGWDILEKLKKIGFNEPKILFIASVRYGILSPILGVFVCLAQKPVSVNR